MLRRRLGGQPRDVVIPMLPWPQEERAHDDALRTALYAALIGHRDRGLGQFHMRRLDDGMLVPEAPSELLGHLFQQLVALVQARAVIDNDDTVGHFIQPFRSASVAVSSTCWPLRFTMIFTC